MTRVGDSGEFGENARIPGADFAKLDVSNGLETPIETRPLGVGERRGEFLELGGVQKEETGAETIDGNAMLTIGRVRDRDVVEDGEASAGCLELGSDDLEEVGNLQALEVEGTGCGCRGNGSESGGSLRGSDAGGERGAGKTLFERTALLLSALFGGESLDGGTVAGLARIDLVSIGWGEGSGGYAGRFGDVLHDSADVARCVVVRPTSLAARLKDVSDELGEVATKTRLGSGARFARH